jgi:hypothetical protein
VIACKALRAVLPGQSGAGGTRESDRRIPVELVSRMMDGSISYDPKARLEPVLSGAAVKHGEKIERLEEVPIFDECSQRQLRNMTRIAQVFDAPAGTMLTRADEPGHEFFFPHPRRNRERRRGHGEARASAARSVLR